MNSIGFDMEGFFNVHFLNNGNKVSYRLVNFVIQGLAFGKRIITF